MALDVQKWKPWNWFRKEEEKEGGSSLPFLQRNEEEKKRRLPSLYSGDNPLANIHREIDRMFENAFDQFGTRLPRFSSSHRDRGGSLLKPQVDIRENKKEYNIAVEVPGVEEDDIRLELADDTLIISGEKKQETEEKDENYEWVERSYGSFQRMLSLPEDASESDIEAKFKKGVLTITIPRKQEEKAEEDRRVIDIKRAA